tara:strand:- start:268 stop:471 length:204 start_codon:yes stop_codon:yes gene_type:complete
MKLVSGRFENDRPPQSGIGRQQGEDGMRELTQAKIINIAKASASVPGNTLPDSESTPPGADKSEAKI